MVLPIYGDLRICSLLSFTYSFTHIIPYHGGYITLAKHCWFAASQSWRGKLLSTNFGLPEFASTCCVRRIWHILNNGLQYHVPSGYNQHFANLHALYLVLLRSILLIPWDMTL